MAETDKDDLISIIDENEKDAPIPEYASFDFGTRYCNFYGYAFAAFYRARKIGSRC